MIRIFFRILLALGLAGYAATVHASGFEIRQWSGTGLGNAYAGATAGAEDVSFMGYNPSGITRHAGDHAAFNLTYIAPHTEFDVDSATTFLGADIGGGDGGDDGAPNAIAPAAFFSHQYTPDLFAGIAVVAPFGLATEYDDDWVGRYHVIESVIRTIEVNPVVAYKVTPRLAIGGGLRVLYARSKLSNAVDFGTIAGGTPTADGFAEVDGDDFGFGYNFGILYELSDATRIGAAYRSRILTNLDGDATFDNSALGDAIGGGLIFIDTGFRAKIDLPEIASFGIHHDISPRWAVMAEAAWTRWSRIEELRVKFDNPLQADNVVTADWDDSWFFALGATYRHSPGLTFRFGVGYDQTPVPDDTRTPIVPDEDRTWVSVGLEYAVGESSHLAVGYTHFFVKDASIDLTTADPNNTFRGNLSGEFELEADFLAVQYRCTF